MKPYSKMTDIELLERIENIYGVADEREDVVHQPSVRERRNEDEKVLVSL
jgi:hypothetical protein